MKPLPILIGLICLLLASCNRVQLPNKLLESVDQTSLQQEAKGLFDKAKQLDDADKQNQTTTHSFEGLYYLTPEHFPPTIKRLNPSQVRYTHNGVWLLYHKWVSKELGYFIPDRPTADLSPDWKEDYEIYEIKPGIFSWRIHG